MSNILIVGASRGVGAALAQAIPEPGDTAWLLSRSKPAYIDSDTSKVEYRWLSADLTQDNTPTEIKAWLQDTPIDLMIYNAGIWESTAFSDNYRFEDIPQEENNRVLAVNLLAPISLIQRLLPNIRAGQASKIILIGSMSGQNNNKSEEVAYAASKFGLRGIAHSLRETLRPDRIPITCINPGTIATEIALEDEADQLESYDGRYGLLLSDLVKVVKLLQSMSRFACVKEIDIPAMDDPNA